MSSLDEYIEQIFPIKCRGFDEACKPILEKAADVKLKVYKKPGSNKVFSSVDCPYIDGEDRDYCKADSAAVELNINYCPYVSEIPICLSED